MLTVLNVVTLPDWLRFLGSLILFLGLGFGALSFYRPARDWSWMQRCASALALSMAMWAVLMPWLSLSGLRLTPLTTALIPLAGWLITTARTDWPRLGQRIQLAWAHDHLRDTLADVLLGGIIGASALVALSALNGLAVGPGIDNYHHTLIAQLFVDNGGLPPNYAPYAPLITFSYHFGFHSVAGALSTLSGIRTVSMVPIVGQLLQAAVALTTAFWAGSYFKSRGAAVTTAAVCGLACALPAAMGSWARYTQLAGLVLLPVLLALFWQWLERRMPWHDVPILAVLIAGLALSHYRVTLMAGLGMLTLYLAWKLRQRQAWPTWREVRSVVGLAVLIALLYGPWLYRTILSRQVGFGFAAASEWVNLDSFFNLDRLGPWTLSHPTNTLLIGLVVVALVVAIFRRSVQVVALAVWSAVLMALSSERALGEYMDTISVFISLFIPGSLLIAWLLSEVWRVSSTFSQRGATGHRAVIGSIAKVMVVGLVMLLAAQGALANRGALQQDNVWVHADDLQVAAWIEQNTPADAVIVGNTFRFSYNPRWVLGQDAAYWFPLLAHRSTLTLPMIYTIERGPAANLEDPLMRIFEVSDNLASPDAVLALQAAGVDYVFVGTRAGPIHRQTLDTSPHFKLAFAAGSAALYRFVGTGPT